MSSTQPAIGIDVSHWQDRIDWNRVAGEGVTFAFCKATEGIYYIDPFYRQNWEGMSRASIRRGAYHFFHPAQDARRQAEFFARNVGWVATDLPPAIDVEKDDGLAPERVLLQLERMLCEIERITKRRPIIYTAAWVWNRLTWATGGAPAWLSNFPLWVANYTNDTHPLLPIGWKSWRVWQFTDQGKVDGVGGGKSAVDKDRFNGSCEELYKWMETMAKPTTPPTIPAMTNQAVINAFYDAFGDEYWAKIVAAGLRHMADPGGARNLLYGGPAIEDLPKLSAGEKKALKAQIIEMSGTIEL